MVNSDAVVIRIWRRAKTNDVTLIVLGVGLLSLGFSLWQLSVPGYLTFYDTGVYLAASIHLVSGVVPYRNYVFVQPPGLVVLLSPLGVIGRLGSTHGAFVVGRIVSALVTALNVSLVTWLVRGRGRVAMVIAGVGLALLPVVVLVSTGVNLEPYCCLLYTSTVGSTRSEVAFGIGGGLVFETQLLPVDNYLNAISCPTSTTCVGVGNNGTQPSYSLGVLANSQWTWSQPSVIAPDQTGTGSFNDVACPTSTCLLYTSRCV